MRVAFFALLFVNLAFLAWAQWVDAPPEAKTSEAIAKLPRLKLVSELPPDQQQRGSADDSVAAIRKVAVQAGAASDAAIAAVSRCVTIGPFNDLAGAARAAAALHTQGFSSEQRAAQGETWDGYWVYIGDVHDEATATKIMKTLDRGGFKDAHLMPDAGEGLRVSVGLFIERDRADRRAKAVEKLGLKTEVADRKEPGTVYWIDLMLKPSDGSVPMQNLIGESGGPGGRLSVQACPKGPGVGPGASPDVAPAGPADKGPGGEVPRTTVAGTPKLS